MPFLTRMSTLIEKFYHMVRQQHWLLRFKKEPSQRWFQAVFPWRFLPSFIFVTETVYENIKIKIKD